VGDVDGGHGIVISLDTHISEELKKEGYARDMIRTIQDMRKEAGYAVMDRIYIDISGAGSEDILDVYTDTICSETLSTISSIDTADLVRTEVYDDIEVRIAVKR
jgi:isoleucyl-tRNA synthetase